jgi:hypothetical protein
LCELEELASRAVQEQSLATGHQMDSEALGQPFGPARNRQFRKDPDAWKFASGSRHSLQTVAFQWLIDGDATRPMVSESRCNHATSRGPRPPQQVTDLVGTNLEMKLQEAGSIAALARSSEWGSSALASTWANRQCRTLMSTSLFLRSGMYPGVEGR